MTTNYTPFKLNQIHTLFYKHKFIGSVVVLAALAVTVLTSLANNTAILLPQSNGFYTAWTNALATIDDPIGSESCVSGDFISTAVTGNRESYNIDLSSIPNGATITSIDVHVFGRGDTAIAGGTYKTFSRLDGADLDATVDITANGIVGCDPEVIQNIDVSDTLKSGATTLQIGVLKTGSSSPATNLVRVGAIRAVVNYTVVNIGPNIPVLVSPNNGSILNDNTPALSASYSDPDSGDLGTTNYRIDSISAADCISASPSNIVASGTSSSTITNNESTTWSPSSTIGNSGTYFWCAQNNDGAALSAWTTMGSFILDTTAPVISGVAPLANSYLKNVTSSSGISYTLSENIASGSIIISRTGGNADAVTHTCNLQGTALATGAHANFAISAGADNCSGGEQTALVDGTTYTFAFNATDTALNTATAVSKTGVVFDTSVPTSTITIASNNATTTLAKAGDSVTITLVANEQINAPTFNYIRSGGAAVANAPVISNPSLDKINWTAVYTVDAGDTNGVVTFQVNYSDLAGNSTTSTSITGPNVTIDKTAPNLSENTPVTTPTNDNTPEYRFNSSEIGTITYAGDCTSTTTTAAVGTNIIIFNEFSAMALTDAVHSNCTISVTDATGNPSSDLAVTAFTVNTVPPVGPTLSEVTQVPNPTNDTTPSYTFSSTATNGVGTITYGGSCGIDSTLPSYTAAGLTNYTVTFGPLAPALYNNCTISVTDGTGTSNLLAVNTFTVDTSAPTLGEITPVTSPTANNTPDYTFSTDENGTMSFGGACSTTPSAATGLDIVPGNKTVTFSLLADGSITDCTVTVTDAAGNPSAALPVTTFIVDTSKPILSEITPVPPQTSDNTPDYTLNSNENGTITYGGDCTSTTTAAVAGANLITFNTVVPLDEGDHSNCTISVKDSAGNDSVNLNVSAFTVDTVSPSAIVDLSSSSQTISTIVLNWSAPGDNAGVGTAALYDLRYSLSPINAGNFSAASSTSGVALPSIAGSTETFTITGLDASTLYYFAIITSDATGNVSTLSNVPSYSTNAVPVVPVEIVTGVGNVGGAGKASCSGAQCTQTDRYKSIAFQSTPNLKPAADEQPKLSCDRSANTEIPFTDIESDVNKLYIRQLYLKCILDGRSEDRFVPEGLVTRAEFVKVLVRVFDLGEAEYKNTFKDVQSGDWFSKYVAKAVEMSFIQVAERFRPNDSINRSEALKELLLAKGVDNIEGYHAHYADMSENDWFYRYVAYSRIKHLFEIEEFVVGKRGMVSNSYDFPRTLKLSDYGSDVQDLKSVLEQMGLFTGTVNQKFDKDLASTILNFQSSRHLPVSGQFDHQTRVKLLSEDLAPRKVRYFMPDKALTRSEMAALLVLINR